MNPALSWLFCQYPRTGLLHACCTKSIALSAANFHNLPDGLAMAVIYAAAKKFLWWKTQVHSTKLIGNDRI